MLWPKACPRCRRDVHLAKDGYGPYRHCLQCGWVQDPLVPQGVQQAA